MNLKQTDLNQQFWFEEEEDEVGSGLKQRAKGKHDEDDKSSSVQ